MNAETYNHTEVRFDMMYKAKLLEPFEPENERNAQRQEYVIGLYHREYNPAQNKFYDCIQTVSYLKKPIRSCYVDGSTLSRCTGFRDKNNQIMWQHDRVRVTYSDTGNSYEGTIEWINGCFVVFHSFMSQCADERRKAPTPLWEFTHYGKHEIERISEE